jgi:peptidoglycan/LPS O-acetylase OafA/YrhL
MRRIYGGAIIVIAGTAALIVAANHHPEAHYSPPFHVSSENVLGTLTLTSPGSGWSQTAYDLVRIGAWALAVLGALTVIVGLIRYLQKRSAA